MSFPTLKIIGERINPGFRRSRELLEKRDLPAIQQLAIEQVAKGAAALTVNAGDFNEKDPAFLRDLVVALQDVVSVPLSFDSPDAQVQRIYLNAWNPQRAPGQRPIVNSIAESRWAMTDVLQITPAQVVVMASERLENGVEMPNTTPEDVAATGARTVERLGELGVKPEDIYIDVSVCPLASDTEGVLRRALDAIALLHTAEATRRCHQVVGLSNIGIMLPKQAVDGRTLGMTLESAFLTLAVPQGLDTILGTPGRDYQHLADDDAILQAFRDILSLDGFEALMQVPSLYTPAEAAVA